MKDDTGIGRLVPDQGDDIARALIQLDDYERLAMLRPVYPKKWDEDGLGGPVVEMPEGEL